MVYAAHDPALDRPVAIKVLSGHGRHTATFARRLTREARMMAAVDHPNVVQIYEVGSHDGAPFIAMEFIDGDELHHWIEDGPRNWKRILEAYVQAAAGLAAAHERGIVHRDFKPSNVLVSEGGRVRVLDFGLALNAQEEGQDGSASVLPHPRERDPKLTQDGTLLGTPAYMAPEQHLGGSVTAAADQFSFCVAAWESLCGVRPFPSTNAEALLAAVRSGQATPPTWPEGMPRSIETILRRGLALEASRRWPSMRALQDALRRALRPAFHWRWAAGLALLGLGAFAFAPHAPTPQACTAPSIDATLDAHRVAQLRAAFADRNAAEIWLDAAPRIEAYLEAWTQAWDATCDVPEEDLRAALRACLDRRREDLDALLDDVVSAAPAYSFAAPELIAQLRPPADCATRPNVGRISQPIESARASLLRASAFADAGRDDAAAELADEALSIAADQQDDALFIDASVARALADAERQRIDRAISALEHAYARAVALGDDARVSAVAVAAGDIQLRKVGDHLAAVDWFRRADVASTRAGHDGIAPSARVYYGYALWQSGRFERAREELEIAVEALRDDHGASDAAAVHAKLRLAGAAAWLNEHDVALDAMLEALDLAERSFGPRSMTRGVVAYEHGDTLVEFGRENEAIAEYRRAIGIFESQLRPGHYRTLKAKQRLGWVLMTIGDLQEAVGLLRVAADGFRETFPRTHPYVITAEGNLVQGLEAAALLEEAVRRGRRLVDDAILAHGPDHVATADAHAMLGKVERARGQHDAARQQLERALEVYRSLDPMPPVTIEALRDLARLERDEGNVEMALGLAEELIGITGTLYPTNADRRDGVLCDVATFYEAAGRHAIARDYLARCPPIEGRPTYSPPANEADDGAEER